MDASILISNFIRNRFPVEWSKTYMYYPDDIYRKIPALPFRFKDDADNQLYVNLIQSVESFKGNIKWTMYQSFEGKKVRNYIICPMQFYELFKYFHESGVFHDVKGYFLEKEFEKLCDDAIEDIPNLYKHLEESFNHN